MARVCCRVMTSSGVPGAAVLLGLGGELASWHDGGDVGAVAGENAFEDCPGGLDCGLAGDDVGEVRFSPAGHGDV